MEISHPTEGYPAITMDEITKDVSTENKSQVPVVSKQSGTKVELAETNAIVVYEKQEIAPQKKGFFRKSKRKSTPSHGQLVQLFLKNIETFSENEAPTVTCNP